MTAPHARGRTVEEPVEISSTPVWIALAHLALIIAIMVGFGAYPALTPKKFIVILVAVTGGSVLMGPLRNINKVIISIPAFFYLAWWVASYLWTFSLWVWFRETQVMFALVTCLVVIACTLSLKDFTRGLVNACYVAIAWTVIYTGLHPGTTMSHSDGVPGWHGHFIHKNGMAPFMLFAIIVVASFEDNRLRRWGAIAVCLALILLSQSTTTLIVGSALLPFSLLIRKLGRAPQGTRSFLLLTWSLVGLTAAAICVTYLPSLLGVAGKDPTLTSRTVIWGNVIDAIADRPLLGYGIGGVWADASAQPTRSILSGLGFTVFHSHNGYLEVALQVGLIGLVLYFAFVVAYCRTCLEILDSNRALASASLLFVALVLLTSISEVMTFDIWFALLVTFHCVGIREARLVDP